MPADCQSATRQTKLSALQVFHVSLTVPISCDLCLEFFERISGRVRITAYEARIMNSHILLALAHSGLSSHADGLWNLIALAVLISFVALAATEGLKHKDK